jgi:tungstate transport system substrate-binding protein
VHARAQEEKSSADGFGVERYPVIYNDIRLIDPKSNPAGIKGMETWPRRPKLSRPKRPSLSRATRDPAHIPLNTILGRPAAIHLDRDKGPWYRSMG